MFDFITGQRSPATFHHRWIHERDLAAVYEIESLSFPEPLQWQPNDFAILFQQQSVVGWVFEGERGSILGYLVYAVPCARRREMVRIAVHPAFRRRGVARAAVAAFADAKANTRTPPLLTAVVHERELVGCQLLRACGWRGKLVRGHFEDGDGVRFELRTAENVP